jgi:hypothetical protein
VSCRAKQVNGEAERRRDPGVCAERWPPRIVAGKRYPRVSGYEARLKLREIQVAKPDGFRGFREPRGYDECDAIGDDWRGLIVPSGVRQPQVGRQRMRDDDELSIGAARLTPDDRVVAGDACKALIERG